MTVQQPNSFRTGPDERGHFGIYGGRFVAETLMPLILELEAAYVKAKTDPKFQKEMDGHLANYVGRPSSLYFAERLTAHCGGAKIYLKREELNHTGAHKINNTIGQVLLAKRLGKERIIAETGAGQHGVATATACALFGLPCVVYMGEEDMRRQRPNVERMNLLGAEGMLKEDGYPMDRPKHAMLWSNAQQAFLRMRANSIEGGTTEIQRNIIGERVLGLPKG